MNSKFKTHLKSISLIFWAVLAVWLQSLKRNKKKSQRNFYFKTSDRVSKNAELYADRKQLKKLQKNAWIFINKKVKENCSFSSFTHDNKIRWVMKFFGVNIFPFFTGFEISIEFLAVNIKGIPRQQNAILTLYALILQ